MIAVLFEVIPAEGKMDEYLDIASKLRPELSKVEGFISIERFQSLANPTKILSLSFWENEQAVAQWRNIEAHRLAQTKGNDSVFNSYRLRVGNIVRDYTSSDREQAPPDSNVYHEK